MPLDLNDPHDRQTVRLSLIASALLGVILATLARRMGWID